MRVAVIGQGPKGLFALSDLVHAWQGPDPLEVHCYDPRPPGAGAGYALDQPDHQRINVRPDILHLPPMEPFVDWLRTHGLGPSDDIPRAMVGRYLDQAREQLVRDAPRGVRIRHHASEVRHLTRTDQGWLVGADLPQLADEVLLATGHAPDHDARLVHRWTPDQPTRLVEAAYPVTTMLTTQRIPPGSVVAVHGAGLTFLDVALALTEGRDEADRPAKILPIARSGQLPHAKPGPFHALMPDEAHLMDVLSRTMPSDPDGVLATVQQAAVELLVLSGHSPEVARRDVATTLRTGWEPDLQRRPRALAALHHSIAVAEMAERPGPAWMLARAWSALFPTIVARLSYPDPLPTPAAWSRFLRAQAVLGKFTFGPVLSQAIRLADLCERGIVDLSWLESGAHVTDRIVDLPDGAQQPDVIVDAVLSPPGVAHARSPLVDALARQGLVRTATGLRGLDVTRTAQCVGADGSPTPGLSALGRSTEDLVIGNDTLGRSLHTESRLWAERLAGTTRG